MFGTEREPRAKATIDPIQLRRAEPRLSLALFIAIMLACTALHVLLEGGGWWFEMAVVTAVVLGAAALVRRLARWRPLPSLVALLALAAYVVLRFAGDTALLLVIPGSGTVERIGRLTEAALESIRTQAIPAVVDSGILLLLVAGVGAITLIADLLAIGLRAPAAAGIPLLGLLIAPALTDFDLSDGFAFALAAAGYLWLLFAARPQRGIPISILTGALAIVAALVVPLALPPVVAEGSGTGAFATGVNPTIDLGKDLRANSAATALTYSTQSGASHYLRLVTLEKFTGSAWAPDRPQQHRSNRVRSFPDPVGLSSDIRTTREVTHITMGRLQSPWLPLPYPTSSVTGLWGHWYWESASLAVSSPDAGVENQIYEATSLVLHPTPRELSDAGSVVPSSMSAYLALPSNLPSIISDTAQKVTAGESGSYARAVALQEYFRSDAFQYSVDAPVKDGYDGTGMDVIAKFLEVKSGYCVHFASAMAVMARSLGIPARVAVGFQGGTVMDAGASGQTNYRVTSQDLHAWPELYFDRVGWVPFEPTPGRGIVPSYADVAVPGVPAPASPAQLAAGSSATPAPSVANDHRPILPKEAAFGAGAAAKDLSVWGWWIGILVLLLALLLAPAAVRVVARAGRVRSGTAGEAWREVMLTAQDVGLRLPATITPREAAFALAPAADGEHLSRLRAAVERESYGRAGTAEVDSTDLRAVIDRLLAGAEPHRRALARFAPRSTWSRILRLFSRSDEAHGSRGVFR
ncbi:transglutaminase family protein [Parafrigoribacterium soli]|uniref:transglutaminase family protein n=1 Tax=Parafrigoribacterium soli TaxID=3144663 RepID=UPI0032ED5E1E